MQEAKTEFVINSKNVFNEYGLIYQEKNSLAMFRYIFMKLSKLKEREDYYYITFIVQISFKKFSPLVAATTPCHDLSISFSEE